MKLSFNKNFYGMQIFWGIGNEREWYTLDQLSEVEKCHTNAEDYDGNNKKHKYRYYPAKVSRTNNLIDITYIKGDPVKPNDWKPNNSWIDAKPGTTRIHLFNNLPTCVEWKPEKSKVWGELQYGIDWVYYPYDLSRLIFDKKINGILSKGSVKKPPGVQKPSKIIGMATAYERDPQVAAFALQEAYGRCQHCKSEAPFITRSGRAYLEVHHKKHLSEGGADTPENIIALCPNCHRNEHFGERFYT